MRNILYSEIYRLRKSVCFRVMCIFSVVFVLVEYITTSTLSTNTAMMDKMTGGMHTAAELEELCRELAGMGILDTLQNMFGNTNAIILAAIFICVFTISTYDSGAMKNLVGKGYPRTGVFFARLLAAETGAVLIYAVTAAAAFLGGILFAGTGQLDGHFFRSFFAYFGMQILYLVGFGAIVVLVCEVARGMAVGILVSVLGLCVFSDFVIQCIEFVLSLVGAPFQVSQFWIITVIRQCPVADIGIRFALGSAAVAVFSFAASLACGLLHFSRKDI